MMSKKINVLKNRAEAHSNLNLYINSVLPKLMKYFEIGNFKVKSNDTEFHKKDELNLREILSHPDKKIRARIDVNSHSITLVADIHYQNGEYGVRYIKECIYIYDRGGKKLYPFEKNLPIYTEKMLISAISTIKAWESKIETAQEVISDIKHKFGLRQ